MMRRLGVVVATLLLGPSYAFAQAGPPADHGGGETDTLGNNLSVPATFVAGATFTGVTCPASATLPNAFGGAAPTDAYTTGTYYYVQGQSTWQAQCKTELAQVVSATADWGDNLEGTALKAGAPIRIEVGLIDSATTAMTGYVVQKLQPDLSDKDSVYGTLATGTPLVAVPTSFPTATDGLRVYDAGAKFSICYTADSTNCPVPLQTMAAEINATGKIVYG